MRRELDEKLCSDYPEIFKNRNGDPRETAMCWGFDVGDGWYPLIDTLCKRLTSKVKYLKSRIEDLEKELINNDVDVDAALKIRQLDKLEGFRIEFNEAIKQVPVAIQVKEKFGELRFYTNGATEADNAIIGFAEDLSRTICEECANMNAQTYYIGWNRTLCDEHADEQYGEEMAEAWRKGELELP